MFQIFPKPKQNASGDTELAQPGVTPQNHPLTSNQAYDIARMRSFIGAVVPSKAYKDLALYALLVFDSFSQLRILSASKANNAAQAAKGAKHERTTASFRAGLDTSKSRKACYLG